MTTDAAKLTERFRKICQGWDLQSGEADMQAHNKALVALHTWLRKGVDEPEVVIRAVQVLLADPETPNVRKRPAVDYVFSQLSAEWTSAGMNDQHVLVLKGMLLAAWPLNLHEGGFSLAQLFESAWWAISHRNAAGVHLQDWRTHQAVNVHTQIAPKLPAIPNVTAPDVAKRLEVPSTSQQLNTIAKYFNHHYVDGIAPAVHAAINTQQQAIELLTEKINTSLDGLGQSVKDTNKLRDALAASLKVLARRDDVSAQVDKQELLWWGQARYCSTLRQPYRRIENSVQRLWWMVWESSELAMRLAVEPSASFLTETVYQLTAIEARKRPLKEWLREFIEAIREIHKKGQHVEAISVGSQLQEIARKDALGLPVTWARIEAVSTRSSPDPLEKSIREHCAVDPETELDLGDWTAWLFRESLLDRKLRTQG